MQDPLEAIKAKNLLKCGHMCRIIVDGNLAEVAKDPSRSVYDFFQSSLDIVLF
jgi:hypothetical protein